MSRKRTEQKITAVEVITDLEQALVHMRMIQNPSSSTPTRAALAVAKAHATGALGGIAVLQGRAFREQH